MLYACKRNAPVSENEERTTRCMCVQAIKRRCGQGCVCVYECLSSSTTALVDSYLCVYVMEVPLKVLQRGAPREEREFVHAISSIDMVVCVIFTLQ